MSEPILWTTDVDVIRAKEARGPRRFTTRGYTGGPLKVSGYALPIIVDLAGLAMPERPITANLHHDDTRIVGHVDNVQNTGRELILSGPVSGTGDAAQEFIGNFDNGYPWAASIEARPTMPAERVKAGEQVTVNGQTFTGPVLVARQSELHGIAFLPRGADKDTTVSIAATFQKGQSKMTTTDPTLLAETITEIFAEYDFGQTPETRKRAAFLRAQVLDGTITVDDLQDRMIRAAEARHKLSEIRASRPAGPSIVSAGDGTERSALQGAVVRHIWGGEACATILGAEAAEAGEMLRCHHFLDLAKQSLIVAGHDIPSGKDGLIRAALSEGHLDQILVDSANKMLLSAYQTYAGAARLLTMRLSANDFLTHTGHRLTGDNRLLPLGAGGEITHNNLESQRFTFEVGTYARICTLSRTEIINDDLAAFQSIPQIMGTAAAALVEELLWKLVLANTGNFFGTANKNYLSGAGSALSLTSLGAAGTKMRQQTDTEGQPVLVVPRFLVVPPELEATADALFASTNIVATGATDATQAGGNPFMGKYQPLVVPHLSNATYTGNSSTAWFLFGDPMTAAFGLAFLNGRDAPIVEQVDLPATQLGIGVRGYHDVGVCAVDPRGAVMSAGA